GPPPGSASTEVLPSLERYTRPWSIETKTISPSARRTGPSEKPTPVAICLGTSVVANVLSPSLFGEIQDPAARANSVSAPAGVASGVSAYTRPVFGPSSEQRIIERISVGS